MGLNKQSKLKERRATQALSEVMLTVLAGTRVIRYKNEPTLIFMTFGRNIPNTLE